MSRTWTREEFEISDDAGRLDVGAVHAFLTRSYWARGIDLERVRRSIAGSLCFGLFHGERQVGFARVVSDRATFAWLGDVYVLEPYRGRGLGRWLVEVVTGHPELVGLRRWQLVTQDAHALYRPFGFGALASPEMHMERHRAPDPGSPARASGGPDAHV